MPHFTTHLAGNKFRPAPARDWWAGLPEDTELDLAPDPANQYDEHAVKVMNAGTHMGFVPMKRGADPTFSQQICAIIAEGRLDKCVKRNESTIEIWYDGGPETDLSGDTQ